jgi:ATP phosphoribosyltransferase
VLLRGREPDPGKADHIGRLQLMLEAVVAARQRRYVMMNAPADALDEIRAVLPSMGAPSVLELADPGQIAIHAAIEADRVWDLLAPLRAAGATSILVVPVERLVP